MIKRYISPVTLEERNSIRSLAGRLIHSPNSEKLFNDLHIYCLNLLEKKGIESGFLRKIKKYKSSNKDIEFWISLQYRERLIMDSLMVDYNEEDSTVNNLHLMRKRGLVRPLDPNKSFKEQFQFIRPGILRIMGTNKKYRIIKYKK